MLPLLSSLLVAASDAGLLSDGVTLPVKYSNEYKCSICMSVVDEMTPAHDTFASSCDEFFSPASCPFGSEAQSFKLEPGLSSRDMCVDNGFCSVSDLLQDVPYSSSSNLDIRVSKAYGSRGYDKIRLSVISNSTLDSPLFSYQKQFQYRWTTNYLNTGVVSVTPGKTNTFKINNQDINVYIPAENAGVRGVILADPCFTSEFIVCAYQNKFQMFNHTIELLNAIHDHDDTHYWMILGDNFYDQSGVPTSQWFSALSQNTKTKILGTVPGLFWSSFFHFMQSCRYV
jgi:hypothetical protein